MDLTAEYARTYGGVPRADQSWHEVLALVNRVGRFEARARLAVADGTNMGQPVSEEMAGIRVLERAKLERTGGV